MSVDLTAAVDFMATHARLLDRRRFDLMIDAAGPAAVLDALNAYRNADGGYGWGLEPDLRSPESQPGAAHHAFEVFAEVAPVRVDEAAGLADWLESVTLADGGLPMALPMGLTAGSARWWQSADPESSSLQISAVAAAAAHDVALHDPAVAAHPWLARATDYCVAQIGRLEDPSAFVLAFCVRFADAICESRPEDSRGALGRLREFVPADGNVPVAAGAEDETLRPLDFAPRPDRPSRTLFSDEVLEADLDRLTSLQQDDGGWIVDFESAGPAAAIEWRGYATASAIQVLHRYGRMPSLRSGGR